MNISLKQIENRFNKASRSYDDVAIVQKNSAEFLTSKILEYRDFTPKTVLDLGTGTGYIPKILLQKFRQSSFYLNDLSSEMIERCKEKFSSFANIHYLTGDMMKLNTDIYDYVISNLAIQWMPDLQHTLRFFHSKASEIFAFSTLMDGTFEEWQNIVSEYEYIKILSYPKPRELIDLCNSLKKREQTFQFWIKDITLFFENTETVMNYLKSLGASASSSMMSLTNLRKLLKAKNQKIKVTYKIFFGIFRGMS